MNAGRRVDYAVRALTYLAGQPPAKVISRAEIETNQDIPSHYLSKIMKDLVASGLVHSRVGSKGGFSLARSAETISIKEVYETVERPIVLMECVLIRAMSVVRMAQYALRYRFGTEPRVFWQITWLA